MTIITINKKRLGATIIIIGLTIVLFGLGKGFESRMQSTVLLQNDIKVLYSYSELDGKLKYKLPSSWKVKKQSISGNEILCHRDFYSEDNKINGFFETWNIQGDLKTFLQNSKDISQKQNLYKHYSLENILINDKEAYLLHYTTAKIEGQDYVGYEYFIANGKQFYRFSFFIKEKDFKENMPAVFEAIVKTLEYN